jgi:hypothetical protein
MTAPTLRAWLDQAWGDHTDHPRAVADAVAARAAALPDDDEGAEALRLGEHVLLGHLADAAGLRALLARTPDRPKLRPLQERGRWALAVLEGRDEPPLDDVLRWGALQNAVQALLLLGRVGEASQRLLADEAAAAAGADLAARRAYAATANNVALALREGPRGDPDRDALMIEAAELSRRAWARDGNWINAERARYQLARCHAALGQGAAALGHARECLRICEAEGADAVERFYAHEALAYAHRAADDDAAAQAQAEHMRALLGQIEDAGLREWCSKDLQTLAP